MNFSRFALMTLFSAVLPAAELSVDGTFSKLDREGMPTDWVQHRNWDGFKPFAKVEVKKYDGFNVLKISETKAKGGVCVRTSTRQKGLSGDRVSVSLKAKGSGEAWVGLYYYTKQGGWNRTSEQRKFKLATDWSEHRFDFILANAGEGETGFYDVTFGGSTGLEAEFTGIKVDFQEGQYRGNANFPSKWQVFAPVNSKFVPSGAELMGIPKTLDGVAGREAVVQNGELDLAKFTAGQKPLSCGWIFGEINSPVECDYSIGAGADWWMTGFLNGKTFVDTSETGNLKYPYSMNNHVRTVRLKKGINFVAFKVITGNKSSTFIVGGANELRKLSTKIKVSKILRMDDYDNASLKRSGDPQHIVGNPTPGLLSPTGQGVYSTATVLPIRFPESKVALPDHASEYFAAGIRIQNFGRVERRDAALNFLFRSGTENFVLSVVHSASSADLTLRALDNGKEVGSYKIPYKMLPADFTVAANRDGEFVVNVDSLAESSNLSFRGEADFFRKHRSFEAELLFRSAGTTAEIVVDNAQHGIASGEVRSSGVPFFVEVDKEFDPVRAKWPLVFADEFDGTTIDLKKWYFSDPKRSRNARLDGKGKLQIITDFNDKGKLETASLWSQEKFKYGYFEAKLKFTKQPGWWAAFWLYGDTNSNPMIDGFEIDIFEDYYTRPVKAGEPFRRVLDHNLHVYTGSTLKSWNYNSTLPGTLDDFYVIGCKWTPFEISYYINGRLMSSSANHSPYSSVTFDGINHSLGIAPIHAIVSGQIMGDAWFSKAQDGKFPEIYEVDHVRIYGYPQNDAPTVEWKKNENELMVPEGTVLKFAVNAEPSKVSKSPVKAAYLFDSGYLIAYKTEPPYEFTVPFTSQFYASTRYAKPGRSGKKPVFADNPHVFSVFVQDAAGKVAHTDTVMKLVKSEKKSTPYQGKAQQIPGAINPAFYDEGGPNVAYCDTTPQNYASKSFRIGEAVDASGTSIGNVSSGEWLNYTVDIEKAGNYKATLRYGTPMGGRHAVMLLLDGKLLGTFELHRHDNPNWGCDTDAVLENLKLPAGRHVVTLLLIGGFNFSTVDFQLQ